MALARNQAFCSILLIPDETGATIRVMMEAKSKLHKRLLIFVFIIALAGLCAFGIRHRDGRGAQIYGEYEAQRELNEWYLLGHEAYVHNRMGVFPSYTHLDMSQGQSPREEFRIFGVAVGKQDDQFGVGEGNEDRKAAFRYILQTKMQSADPEDRIWFVQSLWTERYPGQRADVKSLAADPDARVRQAVQERLAMVGE
jgi:hypothetical protein